MPAVASSLSARSKTPLRTGLALWEIYNTRLLHFHQQFSFDLLCFDLPPDQYVGELKRTAARLDLPNPAKATFFKSKLRSELLSTEAEVPKAMMATYRTLRDIAGCPLTA